MRVQVVADSYQKGVPLFEAIGSIFQEFGYIIGEFSFEAIDKETSPTVTIFGNIEPKNRQKINEMINQEYRKLQQEGRGCKVKFAG